jgi:tetratricopeptide (TPR) repeat protein
MSWLAAAVGADGDVAECVARCERAFAQARELRIPPPPPVYTYLSVSLYWLGRLEEAIDRGRASVQAAREANHTSATMWSLPNLGVALAASGQYGEAMRTFEDARLFGREYGIGTLLARAIAMSAGFHLDVFDFAGNEALAEEARDLARSLNFPPAAVSAGLDLLLNFARRQEVDRTEQLVDDVAEIVANTVGFHGWLWSLRLAEARAEIALARRDWQTAIERAAEAIGQSRARGRVKYHALGLSTRGQALLALGRRQEAIADLRAAVALARPIGDPALFVRIGAGLLAADGDDALAGELGAAVARIAASLPNADMRRRFEAAEAVRIIGRSTA